VTSDPALTAALIEDFSATAHEVVPWFLEQMPPAYFRDTDQRTRQVHLRAIIAARADERPLRLVVKTDDDASWTFFNEGDRPGLLAELLLQIPKDAPLRTAKVHSAQDGSLVLDTFRFGEAPRFDPSDAALAQKRGEVLELAERQGMSADELEAIGRHFEACTHDYLESVTPERICLHYGLCREVEDTDHTAIELSSEPHLEGRVRVNVAAGNARPPVLFERLCNYFGHHQFDIRRAYLDVFDDGAGGNISILGFVLADDGRLSGDTGRFPSIRRDLQRLRWLSHEAIELAYAQAEALDLVQAELAVALSHVVHAHLARDDHFTFSRERLLAWIVRHVDLAARLTQLFADRFDPRAPLDQQTFTDRLRELHAEVDARVREASVRRALHALVATVEGTLRTNFHLPRRYGLALRLDPELVVSDADTRPRPHGVFFVTGRGFDAFHVRFRDIARGGVRVVRPRGPEQYAVESRRLYDEVYDLAAAQQLKNKDIPEGGSKAVILASPDREIEDCVRAFTDGILDLITPTAREHIVDRLGAEELIFLGPDENISPALIEWIAARAQYRGYPLANAFMSSKPGAGINHKEYGVTSEGVNVFLEEALRHAGIDPRRQRFSVKLTGGPDGDVAGNELLILFREYGDKAVVVGLADGSGSAEDPDGLDHEELTRLVKAEAPIAAFNPDRLGPRGRVVPLDAPDGIALRNNLHNRIHADAFVPAGGRPATIHSGNWRDYLDAEGRPSSPLIVEGANLFVTPEARTALSEHGTLIIKDSSANKCGVICSSYEICASMLMSPEELLAHKERFVEEVLTKLRLLARREATLLLREYALSKGEPLPALSVRVSRTIARVNDTILEGFDGIADSAPETVARLVREHMPPVLVELAGDRLDRLPSAYRAGIVAASLATRLVYREGLSYAESLPETQLAALALSYLAREDRCAQLAEAVRAAGMNDADEIGRLLMEGGPRVDLRG